MKNKAQNNRKNNGLTQREKEILLSLKEGKTSREAAQALHITERTVKFHVCNILRKMQAENRTQAVANAMVQGFI